MIDFILVCVAVSIFIIYNIVAISLFGVPESLSNTYYLYEGKKKGLGWIFTIMMYAVALMLIGPWIDLTTYATSYSKYLCFLPFLACGSIAFVGTAPRFKTFGEMEKAVHVGGAICAAIFSLSWVFSVCWPICWLVPVWGAVLLITALLTKTLKSSFMYWLEMIAFGSTFTSIIWLSAYQLWP